MTSSADLTRTDEHWIHVLRGRVTCPRVGDVDLDRCRECTYLVRLAATGSDRPDPTYVVCLGAAADGESDLNDWGW
jgi:hypothetical protein